MCVAATTDKITGCRAKRRNIRRQKKVLRIRANVFECDTIKHHSSHACSTHSLFLLHVYALPRIDKKRKRSIYEFILCHRRTIIFIRPSIHKSSFAVQTNDSREPGIVSILFATIACTQRKAKSFLCMLRSQSLDVSKLDSNSESVASKMGNFHASIAWRLEFGKFVAFPFCVTC